MFSSRSRCLRPKDAASLLGISVPTLWRWLGSKPDMPRPIKLSERVTVFDQDELYRWLSAQRSSEIKGGTSC